MKTLEQRIAALEKLLLPTEFEVKAYVNKDNPNHFLLNTEPNYWVEITDGVKVTWVQTVSKKMKLRKANENELLQIIKLLA